MVSSFERLSVGSQPMETALGTCQSCKRGVFQMCQNEAINGVTRDGGCE